MVPDMRYEIGEVEEAGDTVLTVGTFYGTGADSGAGVPVPLAFITTMREGLAIKVEEFLDLAEARTEFELRGERSH
jgi:ketosteroid isomerase-like protein